MTKVINIMWYWPKATDALLRAANTSGSYRKERKPRATASFTTESQWPVQPSPRQVRKLNFITIFQSQDRWQSCCIPTSCTGAAL